jgi:phage terminase large subunit-like protein
MGRRPKEQYSFNSNAQLLAELGKQLSIAATQVSVLSYVPHAKQRVFHKATEKVRLYIGGNRSGKTLGGVIEDIYWLRKNHPYRKLPIGAEPCRGRVVGVDFDNGVGKILLPQFAASVPKSMLINGSWEDSYNGQTKTLTANDGGFIEFMSYDQDLDKFAGTSRHFIHMDEEPPQPVYTENYARTVDTGGGVWMTMTPVEGLTWVFEQIYEPGLLGTNDRIKVIIVDMTENPHLTDEAKADFMSSLSPEEVESRVKGRFIAMGGLIYKLFDPEKGGRHVLDRSLLPPSNWEVIVGLDHGFNNPTAVGWHMISPEGDIITYAEHYKAGLTVAEQAQAIKLEIQRQGRYPDMMIADPSIRNTDPITGTSILQEYQNAGLHFALGNNDVKAGIVRVNGYMKPRKTVSGKVREKWHITTDCPMHIKELSRYRWQTYKNRKDQADHNLYETPHKKDDHAPDELRYVIMSRPDLSAQLPELEPHRVGPGHYIPGVVDFESTARDFNSLRDQVIQDGYSGAGAGTNIEYDEHLGGVW